MIRFKHLVLIPFLLLSFNYITAQVGINNNGSSPDISAALDVDSNSQGFLAPRMTEDEIMAIWSPAEGLIVYCTDCKPKRIKIFDGRIWVNCNGFPELDPGEVFNTTTGRIWMDKNLGASQVATSSNDALAYGDIYQWGRLSDGHEWRFSGTTTDFCYSDLPGHNDFIIPPSSPFDWRIPGNNGLWQGVTGINNPCPATFRLPTEQEFNEERLSWSSDDAAGAFSSSLKLTTAGYRDYSSGLRQNEGSSGHYWTSSIDGNYSNNIYFNSGQTGNGTSYRATGYSVRCIKELPESIYSLGSGGSCINSILNGSYLKDEVLDASHSFVLEIDVSTPGPWSITTNITNGYDFSGEGVFYSRGITQVTLEGQGTPALAQIDHFSAEASNGGGSCVFDVEVAIPTVINPVSGARWMDRNLGALQIAGGSDDADSFGDLYQWGRFTDGHESRSSFTTSTLSTSDTPGHDYFILPVSAPYDWRNPQNNNLWQGVAGINNPCPSGFRLPSYSEFYTEMESWGVNQNSTGAFNSVLKLTTAGYRDNNNGSLQNEGTGGHYWTSTIDGNYPNNIYFNSGSAATGSSHRSIGYSVRCIKN